MSDVINRGSCPPAEVPIRYEARGGRLREALAELEQARSLLAAIAEVAEVPRPDYRAAEVADYGRLDRSWAEALRRRLMYVQLAAESPGLRFNLEITEQLLRERVASQDLGYVPKAASA